MARLALAPSKGRVGDWLRTKVASAIDVATERLRTERFEQYAQQGQAEEFDLVCDFFRDVAGSMRDKTRAGADGSRGVLAGQTPVDEYATGHPALAYNAYSEYLQPYRDSPVPATHASQHVGVLGRVSIPRAI